MQTYEGVTALLINVFGSGQSENRAMFLYINILLFKNNYLNIVNYIFDSSLFLNVLKAEM